MIICIIFEICVRIRFVTYRRPFSTTEMHGHYAHLFFGMLRFRENDFSLNVLTTLENCRIIIKNDQLNDEFALERDQTRREREQIRRGRTSWLTRDALSKSVSADYINRSRPSRISRRGSQVSATEDRSSATTAHLTR